MKTWITTIGVLLAHSVGLSAQEKPKEVLTYQEYIQEVQQKNIGYAAEKFQIEVAEANIQSASVFEDPEFAVEYFDNGEAKNQMGYGYAGELNWTLELGGKRKARIALAQSQAIGAQWEVQDFFRNLQADATLDYFKAMYQQKMLSLKQAAYEMMFELAQSDEKRYKLGEISRVDAQQSRLEAWTQQNEIFETLAETHAAQEALFLWMGASLSNSAIALATDAPSLERDFNLSELIEQAQKYRSDLRAAEQNKEIASRNIDLAKANRVIDLGLSVGVEHNAEVRNPEAGSPKFNQIKGGVSIPLKFSNQRNKELRIAQLENEQVHRSTQQLALEIKTEVMQAYRMYEGFREQIKQFDAFLIDEARAILEAKTYSYQRGNTSLLEVLDAQRTYNDIQENYAETWFNYASSLIELERAAGIWDIVW